MKKFIISLTRSQRNFYFWKNNDFGYTDDLRQAKYIDEEKIKEMDINFENKITISLEQLGISDFEYKLLKLTKSNSFKCVIDNENDIKSIRAGNLLNQLKKDI